jgi:hypothetical protein
MILKIPKFATLVALSLSLSHGLTQNTAEQSSQEGKCCSVTSQKKHYKRPVNQEISKSGEIE